MTVRESVIQLAKKQGVLRPRDLLQLGVAPENLNRLAKEGLLVRTARGLYSMPDYDWSENHSLAEVAKAVPKGVVCLLSALRYFEIGTQSPHEVWIALPRGAASVPRRQSVRIHSVWFSGMAYEDGIEVHPIEGVDVRIYGLAKTLADCWRLKNRIGMDVALEALRETLRQRIVPVDEIRHHAVKRGAWQSMRPYVEALL